MENSKIQTSHYSLEGMTCMGCVNTITEKLSSLQGIHSVDISLQSKSATIRHTTTLDLSMLSKTVSELGSYQISNHTGIPLQVVTDSPKTQASPVSLSVLKPLLIALSVVTLIAVALEIPRPTLTWQHFLPNFMGAFFFIFSCLNSRISKDLPCRSSAMTS